jgi:hypothetical protein
LNTSDCERTGSTRMARSISSIVSGSYVPVTTTSSRGICWADRTALQRERTARIFEGKRQYNAPGYDRSQTMNWNDAAEDFLNQVLQQTPRPVRDDTETQLRGLSESLAADEGKNRVGVETVIAAWVQSTPETLRSDLPRQMERFGLDPGEYQHLLD